MFPFCYYPTIFPCFQLLSVLHFYTYCSNFVIDKSFDHFSLKLLTALYINKKLASDPNDIVFYRFYSFLFHLNHLFKMNFERIMKDTNTCLMGFFAFLLLLIIFVQCNPDLVTHFVCQKTVTKSRGVTK